MSKFDTEGKLMYLPLSSISQPLSCTESESEIERAAESVKACGRNWVPVIVKITGDYQYEIVANGFIYEVVKKAQMERVWVIIIEPNSAAIESAQILANEAPTAPIETPKPIQEPIQTPPPSELTPLPEIKRYCQERGIMPNGNKRYKSTWLAAVRGSVITTK